jgi:hypoxanthine phosphoribosyltransferase
LRAVDYSKYNIIRFEVLLKKEQIARRIAELGAAITGDYAGKELVLIGVMKGALVFLADLMRAITIPLQVDFVAAASYRTGQKAAGDLIVERETSIPLNGRHVLVVEGIVDTGRTAKLISDQIHKLTPASVAVAALIDKPANRRTKIDIKYKGFTLGNEFVIGYGLDNAQKYRNLPYIGRVIEQDET